MAETKKKPGLLGKFINVLSGKPSEPQEDQGEKISFPNDHREPVDLSFVRNFTASGGKFLYCESEKDAYDFLKQIVAESAVYSVFCKEQNLRSILEKGGLGNFTDKAEDATAFCSSCEYLVSFNGGIMITAKQTAGKKLSELPETFITFARTSQIVENLRAGLTGIRSKYHGDIPSQITTIKGPIKNSARDEVESKTCNKEIYLLLLEDQL